MINIEIYSNGCSSQERVYLGNQWENEDESITFSLPKKFDSYFKYLIAVHKKQNSTRIIPIVKNEVIVSSAITSLNGYWYMYVMCRKQEINLDTENIDIAARKNEHVFISDGFIGIVNKNSIDKNLIDNLPLDSNLQIVYDDLFKLKEELEEKLTAGGYGISHWDELKDKPTEFPPTEHNHNDLYYTKEESDNKYVHYIDKITNAQIEELFKNRRNRRNRKKVNKI